MEESSPRHPQNCDGPFYVVAQDCMACGAPEFASDGLMSHDDGFHCFFARQPKTSDEVDSAIRGAWASCCGAVRYGGRDFDILTRFAQIGESCLCDQGLENSPPIWIRNCVRFDLQSPHFGSEIASCIKFIVDFVSGALAGGACRCVDLKYRGSKASFLYEWPSPKFEHRISIRVEHITDGRWAVRISDQSKATLSVCMHLDRVLQASENFREIRWFSDDDSQPYGDAEDSHPY